jgi:hypothetical protein
MTRGGSGLLRDNTFLAAAVALPLVVVVLFLASSIVPRWLVPAPSYDLLFRAGGPYDQAKPKVSVDFQVRNGRIEATVHALPANSYAQLSTLFHFDHNTMEVREIPWDLPDDLSEGDPPRIIVVDAPGGRRLLERAQAPDGYELSTRSPRGPGLVGDLFGMSGSGQFAALVNRGRVVRLTLPASDRYHLPVSTLGWLIDEGQR